MVVLTVLARECGVDGRPLPLVAMVAAAASGGGDHLLLCLSFFFSSAALARVDGLDVTCDMRGLLFRVCRRMFVRIE